MKSEPHSSINCWCGYDHPEIRPRAVATERAPAYAGHQAHPCPVCLNVHGGEDGIWVHTFRDAETNEPILLTPDAAEAVNRFLQVEGYRFFIDTTLIAPALTERSAT